MSVQAMSWVIDHSKQRGSKFVVLLMIANHAHSDGTTAYPSYDRLATESRISARQVITHVKALQESGELKVEVCKSEYGTNLYSLPLMVSESSTSRWGVKKPSYAIPRHKSAAKLHPNRKEPKEVIERDIIGAEAPITKRPSKEEVQTYMEELGFIKPELDSERFVDHYQAVGWMVGITPLRDWKAKVREWKRRQSKFVADAFGCEDVESENMEAPF